MKITFGIFPFGQQAREIVQIDRTQKKVFVLGVYASAVHARWVGADNKIIVNALAVASEPYIFWRGENADAIIQSIVVPSGLGKLVSADKQFNGPSGLALDELILKPLGLTRNDAWLCDLVPHSCVNPNQNKAIERAYLPIAKRYELSKPTVPTVPTILTNETRRNAIWDEIQESGANILVLLGDKPVQWFLTYFDPRWKRLGDFIKDGQPYGEFWNVEIKGKKMEVLPLAHPRQIAKLGKSSPVWYDQHQIWIKKDPSGLFSHISI
jgi:uracil-DNA glycosylase